MSALERIPLELAGEPEPMPWLCRVHRLRYQGQMFEFEPAGVLSFARRVRLEHELDRPGEFTSELEEAA